MDAYSPTVAPHAAQSPLVLTIDVGSSSVRVMLYDRLGRAVEGIAAQERYALRASSGGASEISPDFLLDLTVRCIDRGLEAAGSFASRISAVAIATLVANIAAVERDGSPISPLYTYADTRDAQDAERLRSQLDEGDIHQRTGAMLRTSYLPARLAWIQRTQPAIWAKAERWMTFGEYLERRFFGRGRVSLSVASWSGLLNRQTLTWDNPLLDAIGAHPSQLGILVDADNPLQGLLPPYASRWRALRDIPWYPAIGDGAAANVGSGCSGYNKIALTIGTSGAMRMMIRNVPRVPEGLWCYRVDHTYALLGGATSEGGNVYTWMQKSFRLTDEPGKGGIASGMPDSHGLTVLPFIAGERSPGWAGDVKATYHGVTLATTPSDLLRATLEAVAYRFALIAERLQNVNTAPYQLVASGGALLNSPFWMQIFADVLNCPVTTSEEKEATSRGAALLALRALGGFSSLETVPAAYGTTYTPNPDFHARYCEAIARQQRLYERLMGSNAELRDAD